MTSHFIPSTVHDWITAFLLIVCVTLLCILVIQMKRLGRPDERSSAARAYAVALVAVSLVITLPLGIILIPDSYPYQILAPIALSLALGVAAKTIYKKYPIF